MPVQPHFDVKITVVGSSSCGKSALLHRLLTNCFRRRLPPTYGCEFGALRARLPNSSPTTAAATTDGGNCSSGGGGCGQSGSQRGAATSGSTAVVGVWDTGGSRFHALSRRFIQGSDAVLVCWDPASRVSWDAMRAWVAEARAQEPAARVYLAACKSDLVLRPRPPSVTMPVEVEHWGGPEQQQQQQGQGHGQQEQQQQQQGQLQQRPGKPPLSGGVRREWAPSPPITPVKAERPQSPGKQDGTAAPASEGPPQSVAQRQAAEVGRQVAEQIAQAAAAEVVASLTGTPLPSPFAAVADKRLSPALEPAGGSPDAEGVGSRHSSGPVVLTASGLLAAPSRGPSIIHWPADPEAWQLYKQQQEQREARRSSGAPPGGRASLRWGGSVECEEEAAEEAPLQPLAVPQVAIDNFCRLAGSPMFWLSARTGEGVADAFITIARDVMEERQQYQQQQRSWGGRTSRRSSQDGSASPFAAATGATHACPPLALRLPQRPRSAAAEAGGSSRGRARAAGGVGLGAHRALSVQPVGGRRQQQQASHEYEVGGSELGLPERQEEPSCRIS